MENKVWILVAGVNGAGKSTFYHIYRKANFSSNLFEFCDSEKFKNLERVNADEILRSFSTWKNKEDSFTALKIAARKRDEMFKQELSFSQETTLSGNSFVKQIKDAQSRGYKVGIIYIGVDSADIAIERVDKRVSDGGHGIPSETIRKCYYDSLRNASSLIGICDGMFFFDNTHHFKIIACCDKQTFVKVPDNKYPEWFEEFIEIPDCMTLKVDQNLDLTTDGPTFPSDVDR